MHYQCGLWFYQLIAGGKKLLLLVFVYLIGSPETLQWIRFEQISQFEMVFSSYFRKRLSFSITAMLMMAVVVVVCGRIKCLVCIAELKKRADATHLLCK